jgi:glycerol dehydrogenase-like iron-containing ADH family enzyme
VPDSRQRCEQLQCHGYVAVGDGLAIGLAKALALRSGHRNVAVPTWFSGPDTTPTALWELQRKHLSQWHARRTARA